MADSYVRFIDEAIRRFKKATEPLTSEMLDVDLRNGLMTGRQLVLHCYEVIGYIYARLDLSYPSIDDLLEPPRLFDGLVNRLETLREHIGDAGPSNDHAMVFRPLCDLLHHTGQLAIWPKLVKEMA